MLKLFLFATLIIGIVQSEAIIAIASGTGYHSCTDYCYKSIYINASKIITTKSNQSNPNNYPYIQQEFTVDPTEFAQLIQYVGDIQLWKSIDSPIGCPDCDGQGSEWIDVYTDEQPKYGVTFEASSTIVDYELLVNSLRSIRQRYFHTYA